jgi:hypothetical protein
MTPSETVAQICGEHLRLEKALAAEIYILSLLSSLRRRVCFRFAPGVLGA